MERAKRPRGHGGQKGHCNHCDRSMPGGPDVCLGMLKGVCQACCGHGKIGDAYVVLGGHPNQLPHEIRDRVELRGQFALNYFADQGCDVPPCEDEAK